MTTPLVLRLLIEGSATGAIKALVGVSGEARKTSQSLSQMDVASAGFAKTRNDIVGLETQLRGLRSVAASALGFAGIGLGVGQVIQLADAYSNMTGRLRLATQYTGDYDQVLASLRTSAGETRSSLQGSVDLFTKMSPALAGIGISGQRAVDIITTVNQAVALSGVSAQAAEAAIVQLGQGFGSGVLRGEELNSVMEQTPALAQAIADGLGVAIGQLRVMAEAGELTSERVAKALEKSAESVRKNFDKLPQTVGSALVALKNELLIYVGETDKAAGGTSTLANMIVALAAAFRDGAPPIVAFTEFIKVMVNGLDGAYRMIQIVGIGLAGYAATAKAALSGDFDGARDIWRQLGQDIDAVLQRQLLTDKKVVESAVDSTKKRELLESQLAAQQDRLNKARAFEAGKTSDSIAAKDKENIDKRIADQQRLVDAVRSAWQSTLAEIDKARQKQTDLLKEAGDYRQRGQDAAFNASLVGKSPEQQAAAKSSRLNDLAGQGNFESARARVAAIEGDAKRYDALAGTAEKKLLAALKLAEDVGDATKAESLGNELAKLKEAGAKLEGKKADDGQDQAAAQATLLNNLQAQLEKMKADARSIEVKAEVSDATSKISGLQQQLAALPESKTITVTVNTVKTGESQTLPDGSTGVVPALPGRAFGGPLPGWAPHDRADNMIYRGTPGEWVIQRPAVRYWGRDFISAINAMRMPKFAFGGELGGSSMVSRLRVPSISASAGGGQRNPDVFDFGPLGKVRARSTSSTASDVEAVLKRAALQFGRR